MSFLDRPEKMRWPRTQKFVLSPEGLAAETDYQERIVASRSEAGRKSFDAARASWATSHKVQPDDGLYLAEVKVKAMSLPELVQALEVCGKTRSDALAALGRLVDGGLVLPLGMT